MTFVNNLLISKYLLGKHRFKFLLFEYLDNKMYTDVNETTKKYFLVKMKEACGDVLSLEPILNFKKVLKESCLLQMATCGRC